MRYRRAFAGAKLKISASKLHLMLQTDRKYGIKNGEIEAIIGGLRGNPFNPDNFDSFRKAYKELPCKNDRQRELILMCCALLPLLPYKNSSLLRWDTNDVNANWHCDFDFYLEDVHQAFERLSLEPPERLTANPSHHPSHTITEQADAFEVVFNGRKISLRKRKGTKYIVELIARQGSPLNALDLYSTVNPPDIDEITRTEAATEHFESLHVATDAAPQGALIDKKTLRDLHQLIANLEEKLEIANESGDLEVVDQLESELSACRAYEQENTKPNGRIALTQSNSQRITRAVSQAIRDAIKQQITPADASLAQHLSNSLSKGRRLIYNPEQPVEWKITYKA